MTITEYMKGNSPIEEREARLFELINSLEVESSQLFEEVMNTNIESIYKLAELINRCKLLSIEYKEINESYNYIKKIEESSLFYASKRYEFKMLLTIMVSLRAFIVNSMLGIVSYVALSRSAGKYLLYELDFINKTLENFDDNRLKTINNVINNSTRIANGKFERITKLAKNDKELRKKIALENKYIYSALCNDGTMDYKELPENVQNGVLNILKNELQEDSNDIDTLIDLLRKKEEEKSTLKLTKK